MLILQVESFSEVSSREHLWNRTIIFSGGFGQLEVSELGRVKPGLVDLISKELLQWLMGILMFLYTNVTFHRNSLKITLCF